MGIWDSPQGTHRLEIGETKEQLILEKGAEEVERTKRYRGDLRFCFGEKRYLFK